MVSALQKIFSFKKNLFWMIPIVFRTIWTPVRAEQKVISACRQHSALELAGGGLLYFQAPSYRSPSL
jgi:hypothetical protein